MPLSFSDEEKALLLTLAQPIAPKERPQFLAEVAAELANCKPSGGVGVGLVHRVGAQVQLRYCLSPKAPSAGKYAR